MKKNNYGPKRLMFCGGGTLGPVTPLLAVIRRLREIGPEFEFTWVGTPQGPEAALIEAEGISFHSLPVAKVTRYPSRSWLTFWADYSKAKHEAQHILNHEKPDAVFAAGGFTQVPIIREAAKRGLACAVHQLDYVPLLSNKVVASKCRLVTASFDYATPQFGRVKPICVATPCRFANAPLPDREQAAEDLGFDPERPIVLVMGGGTGATSLNQALWSILDELLGSIQVLHLTGRGKMAGAPQREGYRAFEFFDERHMAAACSSASLAVSRAGFGALSELAALSKPTIAVPLPNSPQEENVRALTDAVIPVTQGGDFAQTLKTRILELLDNRMQREKLGRNLHQKLPTDDGSELAEKWSGLLV